MIAALGDRREWTIAAVAGVSIALVYTLSPLTVWFAVSMVFLVRWVRRGLEGGERRWITILVVTAIVARVAAIAALFAFTDHAKVPFGSFFGDEEYFIKRAIWLRNTGLGLPMHGADLIYAFDEYGTTSYLYLLAYLQVFVGNAPYGVHFVAIGFYLASACTLYRLARTTLGRVPAFMGLALLLFLPSLFAWSISALKDPLFSLLSALSLVVAVAIVRSRGIWRRIAAVGLVVALAAVLETIRQAGGLLTIVSIAVGSAVALIVSRPKLLLVTIAATPLIVGVVMRRPDIQIRAYESAKFAAGQHWGHANTPGWGYKVLDERFYPNRGALGDMSFDEVARFLVRAVERYFTVPLPWEAPSSSILAYLPEQIAWYGIVLLALVGVPAAFRRDVLVAGLLFGHSLAAVLLVALTSGNVGTLVRHRGLALPYLVWLSAAGACDLLARVRAAGAARAAGSIDRELLRSHPVWP